MMGPVARLIKLTWRVSSFKSGKGVRALTSPARLRWSSMTVIE